MSEHSNDFMGERKYPDAFLARTDMDVYKGRIKEAERLLDLMGTTFVELVANMREVSRCMQPSFGGIETCIEESQECISNALKNMQDVLLEVERQRCIAERAIIENTVYGLPPVKGASSSWRV